MNVGLVSSNCDKELGNEDPRISVIMPVRNGEEFIKSSVVSILNQSFRSFELLVLDDLSSDSTIQIVEEFNDSRIKIFRSHQHLGVAGQLNKGLSSARGEFIARMDADDWSHPRRFEEQIHFLECHSQVGICGTYYLTINSSDKPLDKTRSYYTNGILKFRSFFHNPFCHPSVMFRKKLTDRVGFYTGPNSEDYDLWIRSFDQTDFYIIPKILLHYRIHTKSVSVIENSKEKAASSDFRRRHIKNLLINDSVDNIAIDFMIDNDAGIPTGSGKKIVNAYAVFLERFKQTNKLIGKDFFFINQECAAQYWSIFLYTKEKKAFYQFLKFYFSSPFFDKIAAAYIEQAYFFYFKNRILFSWISLGLSIIKSPFNKANVVLCFQLMKRTIKLVKTSV